MPAPHDTIFRCACILNTKTAGTMPALHDTILRRAGMLPAEYGYSISIPLIVAGSPKSPQPSEISPRLYQHKNDE